MHCLKTMNFKKQIIILFTLLLFWTLPALSIEKPLEGKQIAMLLADSFNAVEAFYPYLRLQEAGAKVVLIGEKANTTYSGRGRYDLVSDMAIADANFEDYDMLIIPGGEAPKTMREIPKMVEFARSFMNDDSRWTAAVCHGPQLLGAAKTLEGKQMTAWPSLRDEMKGYQANWQEIELKSDQAVVIDNEAKLITSPDPWTIDQFTRSIISMLANKN